MKSITGLCLLGVLLPAAAWAQDIYVSPAGHDTAAGTAADPLQTLPRARDVVRARRAAGTVGPGGLTVWLQGGYYDLGATLAFDARDSGAAGAPVVYSGVAGQAAHVTGAARLDPAWFSLATAASAGWKRLEAAARGQVYVADLRAHGFTDLGTFKPRGFGLQATAPMELSINGRPMTLARWPNPDQPLAQTAGAPQAAAITYAGSRPSRWAGATDAWAQGLWSQNWADFHLPITAIDPATSTITFAYAPAQYGLAANRPYYVYNLLEELDQPGEYYLDRAAGQLYVWPQEPLAGAAIQVSVLETPLVQVTGAGHLTWRNVIFEAGRGGLLQVDGSDRVRFEDCLLRNAGQCAAAISGTNSGLDQCEVLDSGEEGVRLSGGNRATLAGAGNYVANTRLARAGRVSWAYQPGVSLDGGCGNLVTHDLLDDMPHSAVIFWGNNHTIAGNEIQRVCAATGDCGAIYTSRGWGTRGNVIAANYIHHLAATEPGGVQGIYLDDCASGVQVLGNVLYRVPGTGIFCGGGRDNLVANNLIALAAVGHYNDDRGQQRINHNAGDNWNLLERLGDDGVSYQQDPWAAAFPACAAIPNSWAAVQRGLWRNPQGCVFSTNAGWGNGTWMLENNASGTGVFSAYAAITGNVPAGAALFSEAAAVDRAQRPAALAAAPAGFVPIAFGSIGPAPGGVAVASAPAAAWLTGRAAGADAVDLRWADSGHLGSDRPAGWELQQQDPVSGLWQVAQSGGGDVRFTTVSGLAAAGARTYRVRGFNRAGSSYSNSVTVPAAAAAPSVGAATRIEAESAYSVAADVGGNGTVGVADGTLDSGRSVTLYDAGDSIRVPLAIPATGSYRLAVRVRSGGSTGATVFWPGGYQFQVDGSPVPLTGDPATLSALDPAYGGCFWGTMSADGLALTAGSHTLQVTAASSWEVVDYVELAPLSAGTAAPVLNLPGDLVVEATSPAGAAVTFATTASDSAGGNLATTAVPASGATFALGVSTVNVSATDAAGTTGRGTFRVTVQDTTAPVLGGLGNLTVEAGSAAGQAVSWAGQATDVVSGRVPVTATPASGTVFPLGPTTVTAQAVDAAGNRAVQQFVVTVQDRTPPQLALPADLVVTTADPLGAVVDFSATAGDAVSGACAVACVPAAGSRFAVGSTAVTVTAADEAGNRATATFAIRVQLAALAAPPGVGAVLRAGAVALNWTPQGGGVTYTVQRGTGGGGYTTLATGIAGGDYTDRSVSPGGVYSYIILARSGETSAASGPVAVVVPAGGDGLASDDIGDVGSPGGSARIGSCYLVAGSGADIWGPGDAFHYDSTPAAGDASVTVRLVGMDDTDPWAKAGVMFRESLAPDAAFVDLFVTPGHGTALQWRDATGHNCGSLATGPGGAPGWLRLVRTGGIFTAYRSEDGVAWWAAGSVPVGLATTLRAGLALTSHARGVEAHATFDSFALGTAAPPPPVQRLEVENNCLVVTEAGSNGTIGVSDGELDSGQSVRLYDAGDRIRLPFTIAVAGTYQVRLRVRSGGTTGPTAFWPGGYDCAVDGAGEAVTGDPASVSAYDGAYGGCFWGTMTTAPLVLGAGAHACEIAAVSNWAVADYLEIVGPLGP